ncbi:MAG: ornithine carbamoyltransferase, partial [Actinomycetota bacterium]
MQRSDLRGKDFISTADWSVEELGLALDVASELKAAFKSGEPHRLLNDKTLFMIFLDLSTRTRNAFEAGMTQLGGHAHFIDANTSQIAHGESPRDMGIILSSYGHGIAIRHDKVPGEGNAYMREVARHSQAPVINLQCDEDHPTQQLADLMTIEEVFGTRDLKGMKVCVSWAYAPSYAKPMSVPQGLALLLPRFGAEVTIARPPEYRLMTHVMDRARALASEGEGT